MEMVIKELCNYDTMVHVQIEIKLDTDKGNDLISIPAILHTDSKKIFINDQTRYSVQKQLWNLIVLKGLGERQLQWNEK